MLRNSTYAETTLKIIDDTQIDPNETIRLTLNADHDEQITIGNESGVTLTIGDNDLSVVSFERAEYTIFEGTTGKVTLLVKPPLTVLTFIGLTTSTTTFSEMIANDDYELSPLQIKLNPGQEEASFVVLIRNDEILQETRKLFVSFVPNESGSIKRGAISTATIIIPDNAAPIASLEVVGGNLRLTEGEESTLRVTLDRAFGEVTDIRIETEGTAIQGVDYTIGDNPVRFSVGNTFVETQLRIIRDGDNQEADETIILTLAADNDQIIDDLDLVDREPLTLTIEGNDVAPQISLIIPSTLAESTNEIDVKHGQPFPVYIRVDAFADIPDSLLLTLDGPQDGTLPTTLMTSALGAGVTTWSELFVGNSTTTAVGQQDYRYCLAGTQNCSSTISVSYSSPAVPEVDVDDEFGPEWVFTLSEQTATPAGCPLNGVGTFPTLLRQEGNIFTSESFLTYTGIVDGNFYSLAYRDPDFGGGGVTYIDIHTTQYSDEPMLFGPSVWWGTNKAGSLCRGTYNIKYTPRPHIDSIAVTSTSVSEDVGNVVVTVTLTYPPVQRVVATLEIEGEDTATDADYQVVERDISFGIGETQTTLNLVIIDDSLAEPDETIILRAVSQDPSKLVGASSTALTIEDNDMLNASLEVVGNDILLEGGDNATLRVTLDLAFDRATSIRIVTTGTATLDGDYRINGNLVELPKGSTYAETSLVVIEDDLVEPDETIILTLEADNAQIRDGAQLTLTIADNDVPAISFDPSDYDISEGTTGKVTLVTDQPPVVETAIELTTRSGTTVRDADYELSTTTVVFKPGQSTASFVVSIIDDSVVQSDRKLYLSFVPDNNSTPGEVSVAVIRIEDNEPEISLRTTTLNPRRVVVTEGDGFALLQLDASRLTASSLTVNLLYTGDGHPNNNAGALTGEPSSAGTPDIETTVTVDTETTTRHTFEVEVKDDRIAAEFTRAVQVDLQEGDGYTVDPDNRRVEVAVMEDDFAEVYFSQSAGSVTEGQDIEFIIIKDLIADLETAVEISFESTGDFFKTMPQNTTVSLPADGAVMSTVKITIRTVDDKDIEADGSLTARIVIIPGSPLRPGDMGRADVRTVTILSDDVPAVISFEEPDYAISEGTTGTITLLADPPPGIKTQIELTADSATILNSEYRLSTTIITFEPDQSTASFEVSIFDDDIVRSTRELSLSINPVDDKTATRGAISETVISVGNNDVSNASLEVVGDNIRFEEGERVTLRVALDLAFDRAVTIQIVPKGGGTATTEDYRINGNPVELPMGSTFVETILDVIDDDLVEPDETIILTLEADNKQIIIDDESSATLTIADNDVPTIEFEPARYVILEGTIGTITLLADQRPVVRTRIELTTDSETILNSEFRLSTTIVVFEPNQSTASFEVSISVRDDFQETRELRLSFSPLDDNSTPGTVSVAVISVEDNGVPIASLEVEGDAIRLEEGGSATLRVTLDRSFEQATSIRIVIAEEGTATTEDYRINGNLVELPQGSTYAETSLEVIEDDLVEPDETIILGLVAHNERIIDTLPGAQLTLTIADNDVPAISFEPR